MKFTGDPRFASNLAALGGYWGTVVMHDLPMALGAHEDVGGSDRAGATCAHEVLIQGYPGYAIGDIELIVGDDELVVGRPVKDPAPAVFHRLPASQDRPPRVNAHHVGTVAPERNHRLEVPFLVGCVEQLVELPDSGLIVVLTHAATVNGV